MPPRHAPVASTVNSWLNTSGSHRPLCERTVMELSRRIQRWQQHPGGPAHAPKPVRVASHCCSKVVSCSAVTALPL